MNFWYSLHEVRSDTFKTYDTALALTQVYSHCLDQTGMLMWHREEVWDGILLSQGKLGVSLTKKVAVVRMAANQLDKQEVGGYDMCHSCVFQLHHEFIMKEHHL